MKQPDNPSLDELQALLQQIGVQVLQGIKHGHFNLQIDGTGNTNGKRSIIMKSGLVHRYQLDIADLPSNLTPLATFYPLAQYPQAATPKTSEKDARVDTDKHNEQGNKDE
jgi:hypothetical protein